MVEMIITYAVLSNEPLYPRTAGKPYSGVEVRLNVDHEFYNRYFLILSPYVMGKDRTVGRAGAEAEIGLKVGDARFSVYHLSEHGLDVEGRPIEYDGIRLRWKLN